MKAKKKLPLIDKFILWFNCLVALALLFSYLAPVVSPQKVWVLAFFGLAYPPLFAGNVIFCIYWVIRRKWLVLVSLISIFLGWNVMTNNIGLHKPGNDDAKGSDPGLIRVMTYNVHNFKRYGSTTDTSTKHQILNIVNKQHPDIIGFQEFYTKRRGHFNMLDSLEKSIGTDYVYFEPIIYNNDEAIGISLFCKYPIVAHGTVPISDSNSENACIYIDVKKGDRVFRIYSVHLQSIRFDPEDYKYLNNITKQGKADVSSVRRLGSKLKIAFIKRSVQVAKIKDHAAKCPYPYIISGDFNDTPSSYVVNQMAVGLKNAFREQGFGFGRTYNGDFPNYQIDYIMASPQFDVMTYRIIEQKLSDHYAVRSDLLLK